MRSTHNSPFIPRRDAEPLARPRRPIRGGDLAVPFEADLDTLLARSDIDAVCVVTPTNLHRDVMVAAPTRVSTSSRRKCSRLVLPTAAIAEAVQTNGVRFCISRAGRWILYAKQAVDDGLLGRVTAVRVRIAHDGAVRDATSPFLRPKSLRRRRQMLPLARTSVADCQAIA